MFEHYLVEKDFVGADMARKFLQMGYTRSRRYANHSSGRKYASSPQHATDNKEYQSKRNNILPQEKDHEDNEKAQSARIFYEFYLKAKSHPDYLIQKEQFLSIIDKNNTL